MNEAINKKGYIITLILIACFLLPSFVSAATDQDRINELYKQIEELQKLANQYKGTIAENQAKGKTLTNEIASIKAQIKSLETQILLTDRKIDKTKIEISGLETEIFDKQEDINDQKATIARLILFLNRFDSENMVTILMKDKSLSELFKQQQYAASMNNQLLALIGDLKDEKKELEDNKNQLNGKKSELEELNQEQAAKKTGLSSTKSQKDSLLKNTKGQESLYQKMLADVQRKETEFFTELRVLEGSIVAGGLYMVHVVADPLPPKGTKLFSYPYDSYHTTQGYGMTSYARRGAYGGAPHSGIDIAAGFGSSIKAIGDGKIIANGVNNTGWGNWVAIQHPGAYNLVSIYAHMSAHAPLPVGSTVRVGQIIGYEGSTGNSTGSHLHLGIYKDFFTFVNQKTGQLNFNFFEGSINPTFYTQ